MTLTSGRIAAIPVNCDFAIMAKENGDKSNLAPRIESSDLESVIRAVVKGSPKFGARLEQNRETLVPAHGIGQSPKRRHSQVNWDR